MEYSSTIWIGFNAFILVMLVLDLKLFHKDAHTVALKEALGWSVFWITLGLVFGLGVYWKLGHDLALKYYAGYLIEKSLSMDNLFVFLMIFSYFKVPPQYQHKVLFWGILGALVMRAIFIFAGITLLDYFHWLIYVFGIFLIFTGIKMATGSDREIHPEKNPLLRLARYFMPVSKDYCYAA